jgi:hypothetical protein
MVSKAEIEAFCNRLLLAMKYERASFEAAVQAAVLGLSEAEVKALRTYFELVGSEQAKLASFRSAWRSYCDRFGVLIEGDVEKSIVDALPRHA